MFLGKWGSAFQLLSGEQEHTGILGKEDVLPSGKTVSEALQNKHPIAQGLKEEALHPLENIPPEANQDIIELIDADLICHAVKQTKGLVGPSGLNAHAWK